jgi:hypothetical protein
MLAQSHGPRSLGRSAMRRSSAALALAGSLLVLSASVAVAGSAPRTINVYLDVRAEWGRTLSDCVTEGVFFGFHTGSSRYVDQGAVVTIDDDTAGVWWWQTDTCEPANSFFRTADVQMAPSDFSIDPRLTSAWVDVDIPVSDGTDSYLFSFDLAYASVGMPDVSVAYGGPDEIRRDRAVVVEIAGTPTSEIPGGFLDFGLAWADMGSLTDIGASASE